MPASFVWFCLGSFCIRFEISLDVAKIRVIFEYELRHGTNASQITVMKCTERIQVSNALCIFSLFDFAVAILTWQMSSENTQSIVMKNCELFLKQSQTTKELTT